MATCTALASGLASSAASWVAGLIPGQTFSGTRTTTGAAVAQFATSIPVTSGAQVVTAGKWLKVAGDTNLYKVVTGVASGSAGNIVIEAPGLLQAIPASATTISVNQVDDAVAIGAGINIEYDIPMAVWGDDTATAVTVTGTLKASRSVSTTLVLRGNLRPGTGGVLDYGKESDPIPAGVIATIVHNESASMSANKWGVDFLQSVVWGGLYLWGAQKLVSTEVQSGGLAINATSMELPAVTGWGVGDTIGFGPVSSDPTTRTARVITGISGSGPYTVSWSGPLPTATPAKVKVVNLTRNVRIVSKTMQTFQSRFSIRWTTGFANNICELGWAEFNGAGNISSNSSGALGIEPQSTSIGSNVIRKSEGMSFNGIASISGATVTYAASGNGLGVGFNAQLMNDFSDAAFFGGAGFTCAEIRSVGGIKLANPAIGGGLFGVGASSFGGGAGGGEVVGGFIVGVTGAFSGSKADNIKYTGVEIDGVTRVVGGTLQLSGPDTFKACIIGQNLGVDGAGMLGGMLVGAAAAVLMDSCQSTAPMLVRGASGLSTASSNFYALNTNVNNDPTANYRYTYGGEQMRDNAVYSRGTSSIRFDCWYSANQLKYSFEVPVAAGGSIAIKGATRYNSAYGTTTPPKVTISGLGITPVEFTDPATGSDTFHTYSLTATNPNAYPGKFTVTYTGQSVADATGAYCWFDGVVDSPWVDSVRHYGYQFLAQAALIVNDKLAVTDEATVLAYPVTIDHGTSTITVSGNATATQIGDYLEADLCQTANQAQAVHYTLGVGGAFTTSYDIVVNTGCTITGEFTTSGDVTLTGTGDVDGVYTDSVGRHVKILAPNLIAGTWVYLYNVTDDALISKVQLSGAGLSLPIVYAADKTVEYRFGYSDATTRKYLIRGTGVLSSSGLQVIDSQVDDPVYAAIAGDPATFTEFAPDFPNLQVDAEETFLVPRMYKWLMWAEASSDGIELMAGAVSSDDGTNVRINVDVVDAMIQNPNAGTNIFARGGYIYRSDGTGWIVPGPGIITPDFGRAYVASGSGIAADVWAAPTRTLTGPEPLVLDNGEQLLTVNTSTGVPKYLARG